MHPFHQLISTSGIKTNLFELIPPLDAFDEKMRDFLHALGSFAQTASEREDIGVVFGVVGEGELEDVEVDEEEEGEGQRAHHDQVQQQI
jgi:hypothetical protein